METKDPLDKYAAYFALEAQLKSKKETFPPDPYWLASHIDPDRNKTYGI